MVVAPGLPESGAGAVRFILCANAPELRGPASMVPIPSEKRELYPFEAIRPSLGMRKSDFFSNLLED